MRNLTLSVSIGLIVSLVVIYILRPLNGAAVAIVVLSCTGIAAGIGRIANTKREGE